MNIWDLPTRLFHWLIAALVGFSWWSAEAGLMDWHFRSGLAALIALLFRLLWGFAGGSTARFRNFVKSPRAVLAYLRRPAGMPEPGGHNPLGAYSVLALLATLSVQVATGLFAEDVDAEASGPLSHLVSFDQGRLAADVHHASFTVLQLLVAMHVLAIAYYRIRGRKLIMPMVTGHDAQLGPDAEPVTGGGAIRAAWILAIAFLIVWWISAGAPI